MISTLQHLHLRLISPENISILLATPDLEDHAVFGRLRKQLPWTVVACTSAASVATHLTESAPSVVVCERTLPDGDWRDVLHACEALQSPPPLLVMSHQADERLWGEVLNLGGYDVLMKPLDPMEIRRAVETAATQYVRPGMAPAVPVEHGYAS